MSKITGKAEGIIERRRVLVKRLRCLQRILDVFESSDDINLLIWQVSLVRNPADDSAKCYVAFGTESDSIHFNSNNLLTDEYTRLEESNSIILAMNKVDEIANGKIMKDIYRYLEKNPLKNFSIEYANNRFTIKMNEKAICEKEESKE